MKNEAEKTGVPTEKLCDALKQHPTTDRQTLPFNMRGAPRPRARAAIERMVRMRIKITLRCHTE